MTRARKRGIGLGRVQGPQESPIKYEPIRESAFPPEPPKTSPNAKTLFGKFCADKGWTVENENLVRCCHRWSTACDDCLKEFEAASKMASKAMRGNERRD